jgi:phosphatidylglycerophosphatase A
MLKKSLSDHISLGIATVGVGYIPLAPGTWGSAVGVLIYLIFRHFENDFLAVVAHKGFPAASVQAWTYVINSILLFGVCAIGIWASTRAADLLKTKDPQQVVIDEVMGQLITFVFVPFMISGWLIFAGFLLFRLFDIWKPFPINILQDLPGGLGVCVDDILAGIYAGLCLSLLYAVVISFS